MPLATSGHDVSTSRGPLIQNPTHELQKQSSPFPHPPGLGLGRGGEPRAGSLCDGKTFAGWTGDTNKTWRVEDGAFTGGTLKEKVPRNEYLIRCEGRRIRSWLNGEVMIDYTEPDESIEQHGLLGLQIHGGGPAQIWYKDITLEELP